MEKASFFQVPIGMAKENIKQAISAYLSKDGKGEYKYPKSARIPIYLYGAPGIGKTAVSRQAAEELGIGFVSFSLTHHTRNSLLGLPVISELKGERYTEYTISEIIAQVLKAVADGQKEGILLLDEFNCASETIMPAMLGFLQTGHIGTHRLPDGWVIVLCGNPPEYNRTARQFDPAVLDRVRMIETYAEYEDFTGYAKKQGIHRLILDFLAINRDLLYAVGERESVSWIKEDIQNKTAMPGNDQRAKQKEVVTPRSWENLSWALKAYEEAHYEVNEQFVHEYLKSEYIAYRFFRFYWISTQSFSKEIAEEVMAGKNPAILAKRFSERSVSYRWNVAEILAEMLESSTGEDEEISGRISNVFKFLKLLPDAEKLQEFLLSKINGSDTLMKVMVKVKNTEYLDLCAREYGLEERQNIA